MISEDQCETERKEIASSVSDNRNFIPSSLLKSSEKKIIDTINNSEEKLSNGASSVVTNDEDQYENIDIDQNLKLPLNRKNPNIKNDQFLNNTEHAASSELHNDNWKISTSKNDDILKLQENTSNEFEDKKSLLGNLRNTNHMHQKEAMIAKNSEDTSNVSIKNERKFFL